MKCCTESYFSPTMKLSVTLKCLKLVFGHGKPTDENKLLTRYYYYVYLINTEGIS